MHGANYIILDKENKNIVGHWGFIPNQFIYKNSIINSGKIENSMILPDYRGKGIYKDFEKYCLNDMKNNNLFLWSISTEKAIQLRLKLGYTYVGQFKEYQQVLLSYNNISLKKIYILFNFFYHELQNPIKAINNIFNRLRNFLTDIPTKISVKSVEFVNILNMINKIRTYNVSTMYRDMKYFEWRFKDNPNIKYDYLQSEDKLFYAIISNNNKFAYIHDMGFIKKNYFDIPPIKYLDALEIYFSKKKYKKIHIKTMKNTLLADLLVNKGYFISKKIFNSNSGCMIFKYNNLKFNFQNWYFTNIFSEGIK